MFLKKVFSIFFLILFFHQNIFTQVTDSLQIKLPESWLGTWKGQMILTYASGKTTGIPIEVDIQKTKHRARWTWKIVYDNGDNGGRHNLGYKPNRIYELIAINSKLGKYVIDEQNSIVLDAFFADNTLSCVYNVENNLVFTTYRLQGDILYFENTMVKNDKPNLSGGQEGRTKVESFEAIVLQRGVLRKELTRK